METLSFISLLLASPLLFFLSLPTYFLSAVSPLSPAVSLSCSSSGAKQPQLLFVLLILVLDLGCHFLSPSLRLCNALLRKGFAYCRRSSAEIIYLRDVLRAADHPFKKRQIRSR